MNWPEERSIKVYTRDTPGYAVVPWQARVVLWPVLRKLDRAGRLELGDEGVEALAALVMLPVEVVTLGLEAWLKRGTFLLQGSCLVMPKFLDAQEARASVAKRCREYRGRVRESKQKVSEPTHDESEATRNVLSATHGNTQRHDQSRSDQNRTDQTRGRDSFALSGSPAQTVRRRKHTPEEIAAKTVVLDYFLERFEAVKGCKPKSVDAADNAAAFRLAKLYGADEAKAIIDRAFQDSFVVDKNATLRFISSKADTFRGKAHANGAAMRNPVQQVPAGGSAWKSVVGKGVES